MILPGSELYNVILLVFGMLCLGTWANTYRMTTKWRYELYCFDFAIGVGLAAVLIGITFGSMGWDGFDLGDDLRIAAKQKDALALGAGMVFNLGNMLLLGGLSIAGVTVGYLIGFGMLLTFGIVLSYVISPIGNAAMLGTGAALILASAVLLGVASRLQALARLAILMREGKTKSTRKAVSIKGIFLAAGGGLVGSVFFPLVNSAHNGENGLGPYSLGLFFAIGIVGSTFVYSLFFLNLPVQGNPLEVTAYFKGKAKFHWLGLLGGVLFYVGLISLLVVARAEGRNVVPMSAIRALMMGAALVGTAWGLFKWNEFEGASGKVKTMLLIAVFIFVVGAIGLSVSAGLSTIG